MAKIPAIVPVSDMRKDVASVLQRLRASREPLVITQRGRAAAILLRVEDYERGERERELLLQLARGEREIAEDDGSDLDAVLAEADALLAE